MDISITFGNHILTSSVVSSLIVVTLLCIFFIIAGSKVKKADPSKPSEGIVLIFELLVTNIEALVANVMGDKKGKYASFIGMLMLYLFTANIFGLVGLTTPTNNLNVTLSVAVFALFYSHYVGIKENGAWTYFKGIIFGEFPPLFILNLVGELAKFISLSFRLFGNILSGGIILGIVVGMGGLIAIPAVPFLNLYFDIFAGLIQTVVFTFLIMTWLSGALAGEED